MGEHTILEWLRDLIEIYTWSELWIIVGSAATMFGTWYLFSLMLRIPNEFVRAVLIWTLIFGLTLGAATTDLLRKHKTE
jgi:TRAP-type C4-dicarboxylate transport system permease small subunit